MPCLYCLEACLIIVLFIALEVCYDYRAPFTMCVGENIVDCHLASGTIS